MSLLENPFSKEYMLDILNRYNKNNPFENIIVRIETLQDSEQSLISRKNFSGHITASVFVLDRTLSKILLVEHKNLNKYIQPGGHVDQTDGSIYFAAKRELEEETGFRDAVFVPFDKSFLDIPIDIDIHTIPENSKKQEPEHVHVDFRYVFILENDNQGKISEEEMGDIVWKPIKEFECMNSDMSRAVRKINKLFSEKRDELFFDKIVRTFSLDLKNHNVVIVSHIVPDILPFIKTLQGLAKEITVIPKPNSISSNILAQIPKEILYSVSRTELRDESVLQKLFPKNETSLIIDIGGYFANEQFIEFNNKEKRVLGIIEDTENGHQKYERLGNDVQLPIVSVARSELKQNEDDLVGYSVAFYTEWVIRKLRRLPKFLTSGIIGYGKLGKGVAKYLFSQNIKPLVYDNNPIKIVEAYKDGCVPATKKKILSNSDMIFCATGNVSINKHDLLNIRPGCHIASVTSSDDELGLDKVDTQFSVKVENNFVTKYENENTYWYLINNGNAVNFIDPDNDRVSDFIRLVQAEIFCALQKLPNERLSHGIQEIRQEDKKRIAHIFLDYYTSL